MTWQPSCDVDVLKQRAKILADIRQFFAQRGVLEVETPLLMQATAAEPHLQNFNVGDKALQTSPESAMKRLLAAGSGPIYQVCKAFRAEERGPKHNPEFTMLEWYRPGFAFEALLQETLSVIELVVGEKLVERTTYKALFEAEFGINPHACETAVLAECANQAGLVTFSDMQHSDWLDLLMSQIIEPKFDPEVLTVVFEFPASQAAMAQCIENEGDTVAKRFEVYFAGLELANGYDELTDADILAEQLQGHDASLLAAAQTGIPASCGVALGVDRLLMAALGVSEIAQVLSFSTDIA